MYITTQIIVSFSCSYLFIYKILNITMLQRAIFMVLVACAVVSEAFVPFFSLPDKTQRIGTPRPLRCWKCENQDVKGCKKHGIIEKCQDGVRQSCQTEIRYSGNRGTPIIKTGCKQGVACSNNKEQNPGAAWTPSQCNTRRMNSVCRCCCVGSMCNKGNRNLLCKFPSTPVRDFAPAALTAPLEEKTCGPQPAAPENGERQCFGDTGLRSFCRYKCNKGYQRVGHEIVICVSKGRDYEWNADPPICEKEEMCSPLPKQPLNGYSFCDGNGKVGTKCIFMCKHGYAVDGASSTVCKPTTSGTDWTNETPTCKKVSCDPLPDFPENGDVECRGIGELGTVCEFTCDAGYDMIGSDKTTCQRTPTGGKWSHPAPICKEVRCTYVPRAPKNGHKECTGDGQLGTVCSFACNSGYRLRGFPSTVCQRTLKKPEAKWSRMVPRCEATCKTLPAQPENGFTTCIGEGEVGTTCKFQCRPGYEVSGYDTTVCEDGLEGPEWTEKNPTCIPVCKPLPETPEYGQKKCVGEGEIGSYCMYSCDSGFRMEGYAEHSCERTANGAEWTSPVPTCIPVCESLPSFPLGDISCDGTGEVGTECAFECNVGYRLRGARTTVCEFQSGGAKWSDHLPICEHYCGPLPTSMENGKVVCDGTGELGTKCQFSCPGEAFELEGHSVITCSLVDDHAQWDYENPTCQPRPRCPNIGELAHGNITCNSDLNVDGTVCEFQCTEASFSLVPGERNTVVCNRDRTWTKRPCCVDCSKVKKDIVIAMDSSGSISPTEWGDMQTFVQEVLKKFKIGQDATQFSIFQFSTSTRSEGYMYFNRYSKPRLINQVKKMRRMASGTMTGKALQYAKKLLDGTRNRKNVPDMVLVLTDGEAEDTDVLWKVSKELRDNGVEILAVAIGPSENFVVQMTKMTGDESKIMMAGSISELTEAFANRLYSKTCQDERECQRNK